MTLLQTLVFVYLAGFVAKAFLMLSTVPTAAGAHRKLMRRIHGIEMPYFVYLLALSAYVLIVAFFLWPKALKDEGFGFFRVYTRRETMRDCIRSFS